jgi:hypothetical protein
MVGVRLGMFDEEMVMVGGREDVDVIVVNDGELLSSLIVVVGA